jgi:hypothetical protein
MTGIPASDWLYTRGAESTRLVRDEKPHGCFLFLYGPGTEVVTYEFADVTECITRQAEIEQTLLAAGYRLAPPSSNRRNKGDKWGGPDHRQAAI